MKFYKLNFSNVKIYPITYLFVAQMQDSSENILRHGGDKGYLNLISGKVQDFENLLKDKLLKLFQKCLESSSNSKLKDFLKDFIR